MLSCYVKHAVKIDGNWRDKTVFLWSADYFGSNWTIIHSIGLDYQLTEEGNIFEMAILDRDRDITY